ncbi:hypothetical protein [Serratia inhibens]|uniref:hypothetical protein n=1 Tax=Serratia inhibens TaxID=2338073 RepID=UPI0008098DD3|nr:hypothetical protein [Serratia inhibens]ANS41630.1 hypothetical protein Q5A_005740 [Serratia inhibens PRI-2C]
MKLAPLWMILLYTQTCSAEWIIAPTYKYISYWDSYDIYPRVLNYNTSDQTPNPCLVTEGQVKPLCEAYAVFNVPGKQLWETIDIGWQELDPAIYTVKTMGRLSGLLRKGAYHNENDYFPGGIPAGTCVYIELFLEKRIAGTGRKLTDCVPIYAQVPGCALTPTAINIDFGSMPPGRTKEISTSLTLKCPGPSNATLRISTLPDERLPLGSDGLAQVQFDWGNGLGVPGAFEVTGQQSVTLRAVVSSDLSATTGTRSGNVGVSISYW